MINYQELFRELRTLNKREFDKVDGFIMGLLARKEHIEIDTKKRRPLLVRKIEAEYR
jgi:hypothetical protein